LRNDNHLPVIAITIGDPAGVGAEAAVKAVLQRNVDQPCWPILIGAKWVVDNAIALVAPEALARCVAMSSIVALDRMRPDQIVVLDTHNLAQTDLVPGKVTRAAGLAAAQDTELAVQLALAGTVDAIVSGPVNKQGLKLAGRDYPGQTEFVQALTNGETPLKILVGGRLRVAQLSSHMSLASAIEKVTQERIVTTTIRFAEALRNAWGIERPKIAVAALNPHAGDNGLLGSEERDIIEPAVREAVAKGYDIVGPVPADVVYGQGESGLYDGVVSMYHDQATIPLKRLKFASVAYGLPIIRTTPGHGTAYDIVGTGTVDPTAMTHAIDLATQLAIHRRASVGRG